MSASIAFFNPKYSISNISFHRSLSRAQTINYFNNLANIIIAVTAIDRRPNSWLSHWLRHATGIHIFFRNGKAKKR
jgi:hypothetical protein